MQTQGNAIPLTPANAAPQTSEPLLTATGVVKVFDRTRALDGAGFELRAGEVHGLLGANGAGKSTLSKVISGHHIPDAGELMFQGRPLRLRSTRDALDAGIAIVMQETSLVPDLSVVENIFLPELARPGRLSYAKLRARGTELLASLGQEHALPLDIEVRRLSAAQRQLVEIAKALGLQAKLIIFDEPTASLSPGEVERLFEIMGRLRADGRGLVFVSHRLEEVFEITDRVTILREGRTVAASREIASLGQAELIRHLVGQDIALVGDAKPPAAARSDAPPALEVSNLAAAPLVRNVSFSVARGEILGLGGLVGAGRSETVEAIFGLRPRTSGTVKIDGKPVDIRRPRQAIKAGIGFVAEDRRVQNIVPDLSVKENLLLAHLGAHKGFGLGYARREAKIKALLEDLGLPADRLLDANMLNFSGGMQQKIIIARWLLLEPKILILDEPTKGVDIGTRASIYAILRDIAAKGVAVVVVSSDFEELLGISDRIVVISDGLSIADMPSALLDEEKLTFLAAPRTSMARNTEMLRELAGAYGGAGFWALLEEDRLICLNSVVSSPAADPGFRPGEAKTMAETAIPASLQRRDSGFVAEADGRQTLLVPIKGRRGHDFGWIGLTLPRGGATPPAEALRARITTMAGSL
jgi:ribose transport system ATP-binding protein/rhamnose transport system ATP-binding protein